LLHKAEDICENTLDCDSCKYVLSGSCKTVLIADYLLANDVIVSPLKLGDKIYQIFGNKIVKIEVSDVEIEFRNFVRKKYRYNYNAFTNDDFGKTVFLTKEEAEERLKKINEMSHIQK
jgi:hypothetical protein